MLDTNNASSLSQYMALDYIPMGVIIISADFNVVFWNRQLETWTGITRDDIVDTNLCDSFPHLGEPKYYPRLESVLGGGPPVVFSSRLHKYFVPALTWDGNQRIQHTVVTSIPIGNESAKAGHALISIEDVTDLTLKIEENKTLKGLLPICSNCKNIRDDEGAWNQLESYISDNSEILFSHSICPRCAHSLYPDFYKKRA